MTSQELKNSILQFAVQGKLVPQNPDDEPASELFKKIKAEKDMLIKEKVLKKAKPSLLLTEDEKPFELPESWEWVRLGQICNFGINESTLSSNISKDNWILELEDIEKETGRIIGYKSKKERDSISNKNIFKAGNVLYSKLRPYLNKVVVVENDGYCSSEIFPLDFGSFIYNKYAQLFLMSPFFVDYANKKSYGTKMPRFGSTDGQNALFSLPPLAEQHRIVDKIEELMHLVEQYGAVELELRQLNTKFPEQLRKSVLQYAVQGKLVLQNPHNESASVLLEKIKAEKIQLIKDKIIKQDKPLPEIKEEEIPFEIPDSWVWVRLGEIVSILGDGIHGTPNYDLNGEYYFVNGNNLNNGKIIFKASTKRINHEEYLKHRKDLNLRTILVSINGTLGNIAFYNNEKIILGKSACYFNLFEPLNMEYVKLIINSSYFEKYAISSATQTTIQNVSLKSMRELLIPLPPLSEQKQIVEKVEEVLSYCNKLK